MAYAKCMRSHGVPNFPDPSDSGGGFPLGGNGIDTSSPAFNAARSGCEHLLAGGPGASQPSQSVEAQLLAFSKCMRAHGVGGFPDPTTERPFGVSNLVFAGGVYLGIPISINASSPVFRRAARSCHSPPDF